MMTERTFSLPETLPVIECTKQLRHIQRDFVLPGLPAGKVGILSAPGGTGKSFLLLELAMSVATEEPLIRGVAPDASGPVRYISFEEDETDLNNRIVSVLEEFPGVDPQEKLYVSSLEGRNLPLLIGDEVFMPAVEWLEKQCHEMRLVVLDPFSKLHESEENSNPAMKKVVQILISTAKKTRCSLLVAHHTSKAATLNGKGGEQQSARGASALVDDVRLCMTLHKPQDADSYTVQLSWAKMNGHAPLNPVFLRRTPTGVLVRDKETGGRLA